MFAMMRRHFHPRSSNQRAQVAVLFAIMSLGIISVTGLAIDGGLEYVSQRAVQGGADTAAQSGASMLADDYLACVNGQPLPFSSSNIAAATSGIASDSSTAQGTATSQPGIDFVTYVPGTAGTGTSGTIQNDGPVAQYVTPFCNDGNWQGPDGVVGNTVNSHPTFVLRLIGINSASATATGTAIFGFAEGGSAPFSVWNALCYQSSADTPLQPGDPVLLYDPQWEHSTCGFSGADSYKGYLALSNELILPEPVGSCIQSGEGTGEKSAPPLTVGETYLVPMVSNFQKGLCPIGTPGPSGTFALTYAGLVAVTITSANSSTITGVVVNTAPTTAGLTICPVNDTHCAPGNSNAPLGVQLWQ